MLIVPRSDKLVVEAEVAPRDTDQLQIGQPAVIRFTAFNQRTTREIAGELTLVGAHEIKDEKSGTSYFKVQVTPSPDHLPKLKRKRLSLGMPVETFIQTNSRTILSYLTKPMVDQIAKAFREE